jgi:hypothetical protein
MVTVRNCSIAIAVILFFACGIAFADMTTTVDLADLFSLVSHGQDGSFGFVNLLESSLGLVATNNDNVKGELELAGTGADPAAFDVRLAYMKVRFPWFRLTAGKTRVSWGDGFFFNAGDVIFESLSLAGSLNGSVLRDDTDFMGLVYVPWESFSFIEAIVLPNPVWMPPGVPLPVDVSRMSYGGRFVTTLSGTKLEAGYLFKGKDITNHPYISFQGNLLFDWNLSVSYSIPGLAPDFENWKSSLTISEGFSTLINFEGSGGLSLRFESVIRPYCTWIESTLPLPQPPLPSPITYGIYIFPEVTYSPDQTLSLIARSLVCPIDWSGVVFAGAYWNIYQGFTIGFLVTGMFGDDNDTYGFGREGDLSFTLSLRYIFGNQTGAATE